MNGWCNSIYLCRILSVGDFNCSHVAMCLLYIVQVFSIPLWIVHLWCKALNWREYNLVKHPEFTSKCSPDLSIFKHPPSSKKIGNLSHWEFDFFWTLDFSTTKHPSLQPMLESSDGDFVFFNIASNIISPFFFGNKK